MSMGMNPARNPGRDRVVTIGMMLVRLGFVIAFVLGLGFLFRLVTAGAAVPVHMAAGLLVIAGLLIAAVRLIGQKRKGAGQVAIAAGVAVVGAAMALTGQGIGHLILMLVAIGLGEMSVAKATKA
jgi:hypothetical protein